MNINAPLDGDGITRTTEELRAELDELRAKVEQLMKDRVGPAVAAAAGETQAVAHAAGTKIRHEASRLGEAVKEQPFAALGVATFAGFILAAVLRR